MESPEGTREHNCPDCQSVIQTGEGACPRCGCPVNSSGRIGSARKKWALVIIAALASAAIGLWFFAGPSQPDDTPQSHYDLAEQYAHSKPVEPISPYDLGFSVHPAAFSPDRETAAWGYQNDEVLVFRGQERVAALKGHDGAIRTLAFSPSGGLLATGSEDKTIKTWSVQHGLEMQSLTGHTGSITSVAFSRDGKMLASGSEDQTVRLWEVSSGQQLASLSGHGGPITAIAFHLKRRELASADSNGMIRFWDLENGHELGSLSAIDAGPIRGMLFSPDGISLASVSQDNTIRLWNTLTGEKRLTIASGGSRVLAIAFSFDGARLASAAINGTVVLWDTATGKPRERFPALHPVVYIWFSPDGSRVFWPSTPVEYLSEARALALLDEVGLASQAAERAIAGFQVPDGLIVELFAAEPMVANPASIALDEQGRVFVAETFRYDREVDLGYAGRGFWLLDDLASQTTADRLKMYKKWQHKTKGGMDAHTKYSERIRRLADTDGDGRADQVTLFSEGYNDPLDGIGSGLLVRDGKVYYTCIPKLWLLADTDDDGIADEKMVLHDGFGVCASLAHDLHGLTWGPDGKLYFSVGDRGYHIETPEGKTLHNPGSGAIFRCNPDGSELEEFARGFRNPQELAFDQYGNLFTCDNNADAGDKSRLIYVVKGGEAGWRMAYETIEGDFSLGPWNMDKLWQTQHDEQAAWVLPAIEHLSSGPSGLAFYPGTGLPNRYKDHFFLCDVVDRKEASGILSFSVQPAGASFKVADSHPFLSNILPTDVDFGYDSKMYISDWINGSSGTGMGRIYTLFDPSRRNDPAIKQAMHLFQEGFEQRSDKELARLLHHPNQHVRRAAQFTLAEGGTKSIDVLKQVVAADSNQLARLHAVWSLGIMGRKDGTVLTHVATLLDDPEDELRAQAAKVLGEGRHSASAEHLQILLADHNPRVRFFAAMALGDLQHREAIVPVINMLRENNDEDLFLRHAGVYCLHAIGDADALMAYVDDSDRAVRLAILLALRRFTDARIATFLADDDQALVTEAARAIHDLPIDPAMPSLAGLIESVSGQEPLVRRVINANFRLADESNAVALIHFAARPNQSQAMRVEAVKALAVWADPPPRDRVTGSHRPLAKRDVAPIVKSIAIDLTELIQDSTGQVQLEAMRLAGLLNIPGVETKYLEWITDDTRTTAIRLEAIRVLANRENAKRDEAIKSALATQEPRLRAEAARMLTKIDPPRALDELTKALQGESVIERQRALATLGMMDHPAVDRILTEWLDRLIRNMVPPPLQLDVIMAALDRRDPVLVRKSSAYMASFQRSSIRTRVQPLLHGGDAERGRTQFDNRVKTQCRRCHKINGTGGVVGPDLTRIGAQQSREYLAEALVAPDRAIAKGYESVVVITNNGNILTGILKAEDNTRLELIAANGETVTVSKSEIEVRKNGKSVMPGDLMSRLSPLVIRDLIEFLANLK